ncbi:hypothetical protein ACOJIV_20620 [Haloarcula sp. AONF1]
MSEPVTGHATGRAEVDAGEATVDVEVFPDGADRLILEIDAQMGEMSILLDAEGASTIAERLASGAWRLREVGDE